MELNESDKEYANGVKAILDKGHNLKLDKSGKIDLWALDYDDPEAFGGHNGPECIACSMPWCIHCLMRDKDEVETCVPPTQ